MRSFLTLFLFGTFLLTGCADDAFAPLDEASGLTDHPAHAAAPDAPDGTFFKAWSAPDASVYYEMSFDDMERPAQSKSGPSQGSFTGQGMYIPEGRVVLGSGEAPDPVPFTIRGSLSEGRHVSLTLEGEDGRLLATASGRANQAYSRLLVDISFVHGRTTSVMLFPEDD